MNALEMLDPADLKQIAGTKKLLADIARHRGDSETADALEREARSLQAQFDPEIPSVTGPP